MNLVDVKDTDPYTCTYPYTVKGSRVCKPCNVLDVQYVLVLYKATGVIEYAFGRCCTLFL